MVQLNFHVTVIFSYSFFISFARFVIGKFSVWNLNTFFRFKYVYLDNNIEWERELVKFSNLETISQVFCLLISNFFKKL